MMFEDLEKWAPSPLILTLIGMSGLMAIEYFSICNVNNYTINNKSVNICDRI